MKFAIVPMDVPRARVVLVRIAIARKKFVKKSRPLRRACNQLGKEHGSYLRPEMTKMSVS